MKCQKCGVEEVRIHFSSNINGRTSNVYLCPLCAAESGCDIDEIVKSSFLQESKTVSDIEYRPKINSRKQFGIEEIIAFMLPLALMQEAGYIADEMQDSCEFNHSGKNINRPDVAVDDTMSRRRELTEMLHVAIEKQEFEKAAFLRDELKELESKGS